MKLPWFMHNHVGHGNTMVGVFPTPYGTFVRSCIDGVMEATWYPMDQGFPGGSTRVVERLATVKADDDGEAELETAIIDYMHSHPELALIKTFDRNTGGPLTWNVIGSGALAALETDHGLIYRIKHSEYVTVEFLSKTGMLQETIGVLAATCDEDTLQKRIDSRVRRRLAYADAKTKPPRRPT